MESEEHIYALSTVSEKSQGREVIPQKEFELCLFSGFCFSGTGLTFTAPRGAVCVPLALPCSLLQPSPSGDSLHKKHPLRAMVPPSTPIQLTFLSENDKRPSRRLTKGIKGTAQLEMAWLQDV